MAFYPAGASASPLGTLQAVAPPAMVAWNYPIGLASSSGGVAASGRIYLARIPLSGAQVTVTNLLMGVGAAGATLTAGENFAGVYDENGDEIGVTADQSGVWTATGLYTMALVGGPFTGSWPFVCAAFVANGTTGPSFIRAMGSGVGGGAVVLGETAATAAFAVNGLSGNTSLPGFFSYASNSIAAGNNPLSFWAGLS
jgi:hypothetical protein